HYRLIKKLPELYHPRYVRVNTLTLTMQEAIDGFRDEGWTLIRHNIDWTYRDFLKVVLELPAEHFIPDFHIPELLVFPPDTQFHDYQCYLQGHIVLQDKASCMAAHMLAPEPGSNVLDMCAAPGMKTTHLAAIVGNKGTIYAIEKDTRRHGVLSDIVQATNSTCVKTINEDALKITDEQCPDIEYILVDPSCSGTGMLGRIETAAPTIQDKRLEVAGFQILILRRALTAFPKAKRVLYSTCSTHTQENEQVVKEVLETTKQFRLVSAKELLKKEWLSFGSDKYEGIGENCLYSKSEVDYTNGFFIAVFERIAPHDERDVYVKGKKWKEIKQEPEDDYEYGNTDMVNYGMSNNNIRNNIKPENDQGQNDESIDYNKSYIKTELKEENTNDQS
ncbi:LOW QUALITY PROTEIN: probable 28S rRNA (cytosine-C(5))-methyltransferase, partial [Ctenocephalides felis]|uniref:LOW QUALITY PROTEIN: probable 28S rRNA (cytosine-C(5))-methyltransferase n=1 Tax=Ctenocephalides felis TaxID=7515 RepID=UPI000E6E2672